MRREEMTVNTTQVRVVGVALGFLLIFLSGMWVRRSGKPYSTGPFTIHKLVGLAAGALLAVIVYRTNQAAPLDPLQIAAIVLTVLLFVGTVAAGGLLSIDKPVPAVVLRVHQFVPVLTVLSTAGTLYFLLGAN
jgi:peptidoglycan/LPS O-acetylase OafA/YrhL